MTTASHQADDVAVLASRSLGSISVTAFIAAINHAYDFGAPAFIVGAIAISLLVILSGRARRTGGRVALVFYGLLNLWIIVGFGLVGGFWNHAVKLAVVAARGEIPTGLEVLFMSPELGSTGYEVSGVLMFVACLFAGHFGYRYARAVLGRARNDASGDSAVRAAPDAAD
jgi:hypothetical protein